MVLSQPSGTLFGWLRSGLGMASRGAVVMAAPVSHASMGPGPPGSRGAWGCTGGMRTAASKGLGGLARASEHPAPEAPLTLLVPLDSKESRRRLHTNSHKPCDSTDNVRATLTSPLPTTASSPAWGKESKAPPVLLPTPELPQPHTASPHRRREGKGTSAFKHTQPLGLHRESQCNKEADKPKPSGGRYTNRCLPGPWGLGREVCLLTKISPN